MCPTTILAVDTSDTFLHIMTRFLEQQEGMRVVGTALDADTALQQALALEPSIVLLELQLPCGTGIATIEHLHAALPDVAVIVLSLLDADAYREAALAAGADDFVSKTQLSTQLLPAIRRGLAAASERRRSVA